MSACLAGDVVRYDARYVPLANKCLKILGNRDALVKCCPEVAGGMSIPRAPAQIVGGTGFDVLAGRARVVDVHGKDVTRYFVKGAEYTLSIVRANHIRVACLKEKSPSCGPQYIYDGTFKDRLIRGVGVTVAILKLNNVHVFSENEIHEFKIFVNQNLPKLYL